MPLVLPPEQIHLSRRSSVTRPSAPDAAPTLRGLQAMSLFTQRVQSNHHRLGIPQ